ncbi:RING finger and CHY zinc finger domain-containing protein 1-like [Orbicella faveolata]|uniref:RING finger and CHY zinc finger domain-containing protein 1-like n=1 Tax=Orbicella faveolata TaxID=48498 RepID=UPI0009E3E491|nr:RING finger and CHY zinc finger domain-containing protein 1-like [Orbicella faveolata]
MFLKVVVDQELNSICHLSEFRVSMINYVMFCIPLRIHKDKSFHCEVCNVCLDKRLEGKHKCRADSGHDECCICLEDAFSGCQILPCSHKVHRECAIAMIQNGIRTCPVCRHPLYSPASE